MPLLNLSADEVLTTTRSVRKRLDFSRPVEPEVIRECLEIALQAPSPGNSQGWHFVIVTDAEKRKAIGELYQRSYKRYMARLMQDAADNAARGGKNPYADNPERLKTLRRVTDSSNYLSDHMTEVPLMLIPCFTGRPDGAPANHQAGMWGSILPATWNFMLAARARGLGTVWTTLHLDYEREAATVLGIPYEKVTQAALIPVAYTLGTNFKPASREPADTVLHWNTWTSEQSKL